MEDVHCVFDNINISTRHSVALYGVFDGHGGKECAVSAADDIPTKFATFMRSQARGNSASFKSPRSSGRSRCNQMH
jgi:serine/threonine protein phosphatase PrpC